MHVGNLAAQLKGQVGFASLSKRVVGFVESPCSLKNTTNEQLEITPERRKSFVLKECNSLLKRHHRVIESSLELMEVSEFREDTGAEEAIRCQERLLVKLIEDLK